MDLIEKMGAAFVERECEGATGFDGQPITWENTGPLRREHLRRCMEAILRAIMPEYDGRAAVNESSGADDVRNRIREILAEP